jgi:hypothetical protein
MQPTINENIMGKKQAQNSINDGKSFKGCLAQSLCITRSTTEIY